MKSKLLWISVMLTIVSFLLVLTSKPLIQIDNLEEIQYQPPTSQNNTISSKHSVSFIDQSLQWNLIAQHRQTSHYLSSFSETLGAGICILDVNFDGWMDVFIVGGSGFTREYGKQAWWHKTSGNKLFINQKGQQLFDASEQSGISTIQHGLACSASDLDADGDIDLIVSGVGGSMIYSNNGKGYFEKIEAPNLLNPLLWTTQVVIADVNGDGLFDLYTTNFVEFKKGAKTFEHNLGFAGNTTVNFSPELYDPQANQLFINRGGFIFELASDNSLITNGLGRSLGARWHDFNGDGNQDLLVLNDFNTSNRLYLANGLGAFTEAPPAFRNLLISGNKDIVINNNNQSVEYYFTRKSGLRNVLLEAKHDNDKPFFSERADYSNLSKSESLFSSDWGALQTDLNNDGRKDIYIASGRPYPDPDAKNIAQAQPNRFYLNLGNNRFLSQAGEDNKVAPKSSRSAVSVDLDNDGQLEVVVSNNNDFVQILGVKNQTQHHWIGFSFPLNHDFLGGKVRLHSGQQEQIQLITLSQNLFSQSDPRLHFGLGLENNPVDVEIDLPNGNKLQFSDLLVDRYYVLNPNNMQLTAQEITIESPSLVTRVGHISAYESLLLARLILQKNVRSHQNIKELWALSEPKVKQRILEIIEGKNEREINPIVFEALGQKDIELVLKAVGILKKQELEYSIPWLIPLIKHKEPRIVCAVAKAFQFFFEEEEAVVFRKNLSIAPMLKSLQESQSDAQICILKALAASEHNRAVPSLLRLLNESSDRKVIAEIIRTLGLIRDARAKNEIIKTLTKNLSKEINIESLIALNRLNYSGIEALFYQHYEVNNSLSKEQQKINLVHKLKELELYFEHAERIVTPTTWLTHAIRNLANKTKEHKSKELTLQLLATLSSSKNKTYYGLVSSYFDEYSGSIKKEVLQAAISLSEPRQAALHEIDLAKLPIETQERLLFELKKQHRFSNGYIQYLSDKYLNSPASRPVILSMVKILQQQNLNYFISLSLKNGKSSDKNKLYKFIIDNSIAIKDIPQSLLGTLSAQAELDFLEWYYQINYEHYEKYLLKIRIKLNNIFSNNALDIRKKLNVFKLAAKKDSFVANQYFDFYLDNLTIQEVLQLIDEVPPCERNTKLLNFANSILTQANSSQAEKLLAAIIIELKTTQQMITYL